MSKKTESSQKIVLINQLQENLLEREKDFRDDMVCACDLRMDNSTGNMIVARREYPLQEQALALIGNRLSIPVEYLRRCPVELRAKNVNHWLSSLPMYKQMLVRYDKDEIRAVLSTRYSTVSNLELVSAVARSLGTTDGWAVKFEANALKMVAQFYNRRAPGELRSGFQILNSETGFCSVEMTAFLFRTVCTNGMVLGEEFEWKRRHTMDRNKIFFELASRFREVMAALPGVASGMELTRGIFVKEPLTVIETLNKKHQLTKGQVSAVERAWPYEQGSTMFNVVNAYTRAGNDRALSLDGRQKMQRIGGRIVEGIQKEGKWAA